MANHTPFQLAVKMALGASDLNQDKTVCMADGSVHIARYFGYRRGRTSFQWAHEVQNTLTIAGFRFGLSDYTSVGKEPYFVAVVTPLDPWTYA